MNIHIQATELTDKEQLRSLLVDAAEQLAGAGSQVLEPRLRWDGHPILLADGGHHPVLISFDPERPQAALLSGLRAVEQLANALPWVNQVYETLDKRQWPPKLAVVSHEAPPGATTVLAGCRCLQLFTFKVLLANGETGLLLERADTMSDCARDTEPSAEKTTTPALGSADNALPALSEEESNYFQQL